MTVRNAVIGGRYRLEERIGCGAMGVVWHAVDQRLGRTVAVKQLVIEDGITAAEAEQARARALREGRIAARLTHPHAITVFDVVDDGVPWLVTEYLPSRSLASVLADQGPLLPQQVATIGWQIADALVAAHADEIVHRDVKPGNVLLGHDGQVKLTDFGVSRASWDVSVTQTGEFAGTPAYFAPEVARGEPPAPVSDVFSLGSTLYTAVEGEPPFGRDDNTFALLQTVAEGRVRPPLRAGPLTAMLMELLRPDPAERPTMATVRERLVDVAAGPAPAREDTSAAAAHTVDAHTADAHTTDAHTTDAHTTDAHTTDAHTADAHTTDAPAAGPPTAPGNARAVPRWLRRRHPAGLLLSGLTACAAIALAGFAAVAPTTTGPDGEPALARPATSTGAGPNSAGPNSAGPNSAGPNSAGPNSPTTPAPSSNPPSPPAGHATGDGPGDPGSPGELRRVAREYYALLPEDTETAYTYLGTAERAKVGGYTGFARFWSSIDEVRIRGPLRVTESTVRLDLALRPRGGSTVYEQHRLTVGTDRAGPVIESAVLLGRFDPRTAADQAAQ